MPRESCVAQYLLASYTCDDPYIVGMGLIVRHEPILTLNGFNDAKKTFKITQLESISQICIRATYHVWSKIYVTAKLYSETTYHLINGTTEVASQVYKIDQYQYDDAIVTVNRAEEQHPFSHCS